MFCVYLGNLAQLPRGHCSAYTVNFHDYFTAHLVSTLNLQLTTFKLCMTENRNGRMHC